MKCREPFAASEEAAAVRDMPGTALTPAPVRRPRRLRRSEGIRKLVREASLGPEQLIYPMFVVPGRGVEEEIPSMPGQYHLSPERAAEAARRVADLGIGGVLLFGLPERKDETGSEAWNPRGPVQEAVRAIKAAVPGLPVVTDVCLDAYTTHGHCGVLNPQGEVDNDATLPLLARVARSHAEAGADWVAPSDMMDGRVAAIRRELDEAGYQGVAILAYSAKYASSFYGPFRDAAHCAPAFGDRRGYQMDPANAREAVIEALLDLEEGADVVMVKPALPYLDVIHRLRARINSPLAAYQVSGEYAMLRAAADRGWLDYRAGVLESLLAIRRAGADIVLTYFAPEVARWLS